MATRRKQPRGKNTRARYCISSDSTIEPIMAVFSGSRRNRKTCHINGATFPRLSRGPDKHMLAVGRLQHQNPALQVARLQQHPSTPTDTTNSLWAWSPFYSRNARPEAGASIHIWLEDLSSAYVRFCLRMSHTFSLKPHSSNTQRHMANKNHN